ncbi:MAG: DUF3352 domain-containing protein [Treponema sp.]|jgi:hypothetical protein|nr:DUF3352 domain-containing protein [Treponema sp.]
MAHGTRKNRGFLKKLFRGLFFTAAALLLVWAAVSLVGRIDPSAVIPSSYTVRLRAANPVRLIDRILEHESLPEIVNIAALPDVMPLVKALRENGLIRNPVLRFLAQGSLEGVLLEGGLPGGENVRGQTGGRFLAAWDAGFYSPLLRIFPLISRFVDIPGLYHVRSPRGSRFEYRMEDGSTFFFGPRRNLLVMCNDSRLFELAAGGRINVSPGSGPGAGESAGLRLPESGNYDISLLVSPVFLSNIFAAQNPGIANIMETVEVSGLVEAGISVLPRKLELHLTAAAVSKNPALGRILEKRSQTPGIVERLPAAVQYGTVLAAGSLSELYDTAAVFSGPELGETIRRADRSARAFLGMTLDELLFSWPGREFAVFGLEGRVHPVFAVQIADERKREEVFRKVFKTIVLNENARLNLDGMRIPRIEIPAFLEPVLRHAGFRVMSPCYVIHDGYLLLSESAETLLSAVRAMRKNDVLLKTHVWRGLAGGPPSAAYSGTFSLYYSLDHSLPFFLRGNTGMSAFLGIYRQGLARLDFDQGQIRLSLSVIPGSGGGVALMSGYPLAVGANPHNQIYGVNTGKPAENRIFLTRDGAALSVNPVDNSVREFEGQPPGQLWVVSDEGLRPKNAADAYAWVVSAQGRVTLVNGNMEPLRGFPLSTGLRLSSPPAASEGRLFLCDEDGKVHSVDSRGTLSTWETAFAAAVRSPPAVLGSAKNGRTLAAVYPKSFFGEIWLVSAGGAARGAETGAEGRPLPNWPVQVPGIAFGSPLLFSHNGQTLVAFITQAGGLSVFDESAAPVPPFPLDLDGVFYLQPVFDGSGFWLVSSGGTLFQVGLGGEVLSQPIPGFSVMEEGYITLFDSDGDKIPEIFITGEGNMLHGYSRNFRSLEGFPLPVWGRPLFADLNNDGKGECTGAGMDKLLYRWQFR